jgi:hypothetical protein
MVASLRLVLCHLVLRLVARGISLLVSQGSPASSAGFHQTLELHLAKHNSSDNDSTTQKHSLIPINQSNELSTSSGHQDACNSFVI